MRDQYIPLSVPHLTGREEEYVVDCIRSNWISSVGDYVARFEKEFAAYVGTPHAVAVMNGTAALHLALLLGGVDAGTDVFVPSLTFVAPVNVVRYAGAHPVFVDVDSDTIGISPQSISTYIEANCETDESGLRNRITGRYIRAIIAVHLYGSVCDLAALSELARCYGLSLIEDAAEAVGCRFGRSHAGVVGDCGCFSFNGNKVLSTGGGGMLVTADERKAARAAHLSTQAKTDPFNYVHDEIGYNYRMTNIQAAIGVAQLEHLDEMLARKRAVFDRYADAFSRLGTVRLLRPQPPVTSNCWLALLQIDSSEKQRFIKSMEAAGIQTRPMWSLAHELPMYTGYPGTDLENSEYFHEHTFCLPCQSGMSESEVDRVVGAVEEFAAGATV